MHLKKIVEFVEFIGLRNHSMDDVLRHLTLSTFDHIDATCVVVSQLRDEGTIEVSGLFGFDRSAFQVFPGNVRLADPYPIPEVMRLRRMVWINTLPKWPKEYPTLKVIDFPNKEKTVINFPIDKYGTPVGCMTVFSTKKIEPSAELQAFLRAIGSVFSLYLFKDDLEMRIKEVAESLGRGKQKSQPCESPDQLSERQTLILQLMSEGKTNLEISELIGYSESTVRQETIKIFAALAVRNRFEAGKKFRELQSSKQE